MRTGHPPTHRHVRMPLSLRGWLSLTCVVAVLGGLSGCGNTAASGKTLAYMVSGTLLINGNPGADAWVTLAPDGIENVPVPTARVKADGTFVMEVSREELKNFETPGDPAGDYKVLILMPRDPNSMLTPDRLAGAYSTPEKSPKTVTIQLGENQLEPIRLDNVKVAN